MAESYALDASALLALLNDEAGADRVEAILDTAVISAVNYAEVVAKIIERGGSSALVAAMLDPLHLSIVDFDRAQAMGSGQLRLTTRAAGLSFGDRACLALASTRKLTAVTCDRAWSGLELDIAVELLR